MESLITQHLETWTTAIETKSAAGRGKSNKLNLYGMKKLRELILELAMRGQLVPQDPNDEPASVLLEKIAAEKEQLVKDKKIRKYKPLHTIKKQETLFALPAQWEWFRIGNCLEFNYGKALSAKNRDESGFIDVYGSNGIVGKHTGQLTGEPCIVIGRKGSAGALNKALKPSWTTDVAYYLIPPFGFDYGYTFILLQTLKLDQLGKGIKPGVNRNEAYSLIGALPPLAEQHRIVTKVDELMALCDAIEQQQENSISAHKTLVENLLSALTNAAEKGEFDQAWQRIATHFDTLFTTEHSIDQLKQTILQLAVMGKLVPQDPNDEPASVLLEKIAAEKAQLIKEKKIKKQKVLPPIGEDEKPFDLPEGWEWANLNDVLALVTDGDHQAPPKSETGIPFLVIGNLNTGKVLLENCRFVPLEYYENLDWGRRPTQGDLLYTVTGSYGIPIKVNLSDRFCVQRHVAILKVTNSTPQNYLCFLLKSSYSLEYAKSIATGIAQKTVPLTGLRKMPISIPPEEEQKRIVAKVDELMTLCDQLKIRIKASQTTQLHLADALSQQAVS